MVIKFGFRLHRETLKESLKTSNYNLLFLSKAKNLDEKFDYFFSYMREYKKDFYGFDTRCNQLLYFDEDGWYFIEFMEGI